MKSYIGDKYGRLTVLYQYQYKKHKVRCSCACECGNMHDAAIASLKSGTVRSCGCLFKEWNKSGNARRKHNGKGTRLYQIWKNMRERCYTATPRNRKNYGKYGMRGISICDEWDDFSAFKNWAENNGYSDELTIERIDNDGNYCPENCRWATYEEQANNRRSTVYYEVNGEKKTLSELSKICGVSYGTLWSRIHCLNWSVEKAIGVES